MSFRDWGWGFGLPSFQGFGRRFLEQGAVFIGPSADSDRSVYLTFLSSLAVRLRRLKDTRGVQDMLKACSRSSLPLSFGEISSGRAACPKNSGHWLT